MNVWTSLADGEQMGSWLALSVVFVTIALIVLPLIYISKQQKLRRQISTHLVTSTYSLPAPLTPAELSYLFSPNIGKRQLYASLLQLVNEGILNTSMSNGDMTFKLRPGVDTQMSLSSAYILGVFERVTHDVTMRDFLEGNMSYRVPNTNEKIDGSKQYVYWWVVREGLRQRGIIVSRPVKAYLSVIVKALIKMLLITLIFVTGLQILGMIMRGDISLSATSEFIGHAALWVVTFSSLFFLISFLSVRIRGVVLGRSWILTDKKQRLHNQFEAFREYVRLVYENKVTFESDAALQNAKRKILPYATAFGFVPLPKHFSKREK